MSVSDTVNQTAGEVSAMAEEISADLGAVILAGGLARRMGGVDKGLVLLNQRPMIRYVIDTIRPVVDTLIINANRSIEQYQSMGLAVIADSHGGHLGPLAGLSAAIDALDTQLVFMCPCDSPFIDARLPIRLATHCRQHDLDVAVAQGEGRMQPVFCVVNRRVKASLDAFLAAGERKIDRWYASQNTQLVDCSDLSVSFHNINTEDERVSAEKANIP